MFALSTKYDPMDVERSKNFRLIKVKNDCELRDFIEKEYKHPFRRGCVFFEFTHEIENISEWNEVIFMKKVSIYDILISLCIYHRLGKFLCHNIYM